MTLLYKLTTSDFRTRPNMPGETYWSEGFTLKTNGKGSLCGPGFIHAYTHPLLAVLLNPVHADYQNPVLWEAEGEVIKSDKGLKVGCTKLTTIRRIPSPKITQEQRIRFAILCALEVCANVSFNRWASSWFSNKDRSASAAAYAARAAQTAHAARSAAYAAQSAAQITHAAHAATYAAHAATYAAIQDRVLDLVGLAEEACQIQEHKP